MVERQLRRRGIQDECVLRAMAEVPRERFLSPDIRSEAYRDGAVAIGEGQTMSQPWIVACMTSLLELQGGERVLEVGTVSVYGYSNVEVRAGDGTQGAPDRAPFGGALVTAVAEGEPPRAIVEQLAPGAALVCPIRDGLGEHLVRFRGGDQERVVAVRFVPLVSD
jgi:protein-L-isoaspartate(D-aspartate) O-methyltransferase